MDSLRSSFFSSSSPISSNSPGNQMALSYVLNNLSPTDCVSKSPQSFSQQKPITSNSSSLTLESRFNLDKHSSLPIQVHDMPSDDPSPSNWSGSVVQSLPCVSDSPSCSYKQRLDLRRVSISEQPSPSRPSTPFSPQQTPHYNTNTNAYPTYSTPPQPAPTSSSSAEFGDTSPFHHHIPALHATPNQNVGSKITSHLHPLTPAPHEIKIETAKAESPGKGVYQPDDSYWHPHHLPLHLTEKKIPKSRSSSSSSLCLTSTSSSTSADEPSTIPPSSSDLSVPSYLSHKNTPYTTEQVDFILYGRDSLKFSWPTLLEEFRTQFPLRRNASVQAIQGRYYRAQMSIWEEGDGDVVGERDDNGSGGGKRKRKRKRDDGNGCGGDSKEEGGGGGEKAGSKRKKIGQQEWIKLEEERGILSKSRKRQRKSRGWHFKRVNIRDRGVKGIKVLGLKYELVDLEATNTIICEAADTKTNDKPDTRCGAERLLSYNWSIIKDVDRERAVKIIAKRVQGSAGSRR